MKPHYKIINEIVGKHFQSMFAELVESDIGFDGDVTPMVANLFEDMQEEITDIIKSNLSR